jgi:copper resistance protein B
MTRLLALILAACVTPAFAQGHDHDEHQGHHPAPPPQPAQDPHAGHPSPPAMPDPHAGHRMEPRESAQDPHAGHAMPAPTAAPPVAPPPPGALGGPVHAADTIFDPAEMARIRAAVTAEHGGMRTSRFLVDRLEASFRRGRDGYGWEGVEFWHGTPTDRFVLVSRGEGAFGEGIERVEAQALWSHALDPWFDLRLGARADFRRGADRAWAVLGINGMAPYWFEVAATAFLSETGEAMARFEGEYDLRITQRLILQPAAEIELSAQDVPELGVGSGLSKAEAGVRLRYEFVPEFAPYFGVEYERAFGGTADYRRLAGARAGGWSLLMGVRAWF